MFFLILVLSPNLKAQNSEKDKQFCNIVWIVADDLGTDISPYGNKIIHTPNLDSLAKESIVYQNLHTTTAVCPPSRSGMITGMYQGSINSQPYRTRYNQKLPEPVKPVTEYFKKAGYFVTNRHGNSNDKGGKTDYNFQYNAKDLYDGVH